MRVERAESEFRKYLASQRLKYTPERREILSEVLASDSLFDADMLVNRMQAHARPVSRATVYRTLDLLVKLGVLRRTSMGEKATLYENNLKWKSNGHLLCVHCGATAEFPIAATVDEMIQEICQRSGFRPRNRSVQVYGYCEACRDVPIVDFNDADGAA